MAPCPICNSVGQQGVYPNLGNCDLLQAAYILAGLAMMLNIRLSYSSAPYALIRFKLPENLFSVFVRRMASALELWCLPSMLLGNIIDLFQKLVKGGHQVRALEYAKHYDVQGTAKGSQLNTKARELQNMANTLKTKADQQFSGYEVSTVAGVLANMAIELHGKTNTLPSGALSDLSAQATKLKEAAKKDGPSADTDSLHHHADELAKDTTNATKAIAVIGAFGKVKLAYYELANQDKYKEHKPAQGSRPLGSGTPKGNVQAVEGAWNLVKISFEALCKAIIKEFAGSLASTGGKLAANDGGTASANADTVIEGFNVVESSYNELRNNSSVKTQFEAVKLIYNQMLNLTKLKTLAGKINSNADKTTNLKAAAGELNTVAQDLQSNPNADNARNFKDKYEAFGRAYNDPSNESEQAAVTSHWTALKNVYENIGFCYKDTKFFSIIVPSIICQWLNFLTYVLLLVVYVMGGDYGHLTVFYFMIAISGVVFGINMTLVYSVDFFYIPVYIVGENCFPAITSFIHYMSTLIFGNRRKWNSDFLLVNIDIWVAIIISFVAAVVWTYGYLCEGNPVADMKHIHAFGFGGEFKQEAISPFLMIVVGMGLVYAIYPGIAPGMIVPFYLIDKIEMVLLVATIFPPVIIAILRKHKPSWSPQNFVGPGFGGWKQHEYGWAPPKTTVYGQIWHLFDLLMVIKIVLAGIFIYSLHYKESHISRSIINQPKTSTFLSITFYMCHEILLALGFSGFIGNDGGDLILIPQYIGALFMIFLAFYSEGYIIEYKSHNPAHWPTTGMTKWNAFCFWVRVTCKIIYSISRRISTRI